MIVKKIDLYEYFKVSRPQGCAGYLTVFTHDKTRNYATGRIRPAMLVIAGGGYDYVSPREQMPIALKYVAEGFNSYILDYSVAENSKFPNPVLESVMAMLYIRETAEEYATDPTKICGVGFSAGGHLVGMLATAYNNSEIRKILGDKVDNARLDAVIFSYPVILTENTHTGSIQNITGGDKSLLGLVNIANNVNENTPPAFIWATVNDACVPSESSLQLALAYKKSGVPFELHMFEDGKHGLSTAQEEVNTPNAPVSVWIDLSLTWLKQRGFVHSIKD
jgi:acetyl esterase/lipase